MTLGSQSNPMNKESQRSSSSFEQHQPSGNRDIYLNMMKNKEIMTKKVTKGGGFEIH